MSTVRLILLGTLVGLFAGCLSTGPKATGEIVRSSVRVAMSDSVGEKANAFFLQRSMLCRKAFDEAVSNLVERTGRAEDSLRGATICGIDETCADGVYTLSLDVVWSEARETAADLIVRGRDIPTAGVYVPTADEKQTFPAWIGPKQVRDADGNIRFLGISAMALGRNTVLSQQNRRRAELDAQAMAVRAFLGKERKMADVKAAFRQVFCGESRHPLCPDRRMYLCVYEVTELALP